MATRLGKLDRFLLVLALGSAIYGICVFAGAGGTFFSTRRSEEISFKSISTEDLKSHLGLGHQRGGSSSSPLLLVEVGDYGCRPCRDAAPQVEAYLRKRSDVQYYFFHDPVERVHPHSLEASLAAEAAGLQGKFWEMHAILLQMQKEWSESEEPEQLFVDYADSLHLDVNAFSIAMHSAATLARVRASQQFVRSLKLRSLPAFILNGVNLEANVQLLDMQSQIVQGKPVEIHFRLNPRYLPPPSPERIPNGSRSDPFVGEGTINRIVRNVVPPTILITHSAIPNFMTEMQMVAPVADPSILNRLSPGMAVIVKFEIVNGDEFQIFEIDPASKVRR